MELGSFDQTVLIFGGPYSNLSATQAIREEASRLGISRVRVICSGDLVAYCAEPEETVNLIRDWDIPVVMGNCEESLAADAPDCGCGFETESACSLLSVEWYRFARANVSSSNKKWMAQLPRRINFQLGGKSIAVVHGSLDSINEFVFQSSPADLKADQLMRSNVDIIIGGHSGIPFSNTLDKGYWLNSGVIGMPANDGTCDGWYMLLVPTDGGIEVSWHRLTYNVEQTIAAMQQADVSAAYRECLGNGLWPSVDVLPAEETAQMGQPIKLTTLMIA